MNQRRDDDTITYYDLLQFSIIAYILTHIILVFVMPPDIVELLFFNSWFMIPIFFGITSFAKWGGSKRR